MTLDAVIWDRCAIAINSYVPSRSRPSHPGRCIHPTHARTLATVSSRSKTDQIETLCPEQKLGLGREVLYIMGRPAAKGVVWFFGATVENERIEKKRKCLDARIAT